MPSKMFHVKQFELRRFDLPKMFHVKHFETVHGELVWKEMFHVKYFLCEWLLLR